MSRTMITYIILAIVGILIILTFLGKKSVHHEISIKASPQHVWVVLTDTDSYNKWNPVMKLLNGEIKEGNKVKYEDYAGIAVNFWNPKPVQAAYQRLNEAIKKRAESKN